MKSKKLYTLFLIVFILSSCELFNQEEEVPKKNGIELEAPSGLVATIDEIDQITLKWDYSYSDVKVNIYRSDKKESNFTLLKSIEGGIKEYIDKDLAPNSQFYYYIAFEYKNSEGPSSDTAYGISLFKTQELFCTEGYQELTFTWDEREGIDYYKLYRSYENLVADNIKANSYSFKPANSWEEEYYLVAVAGGKEGEPSKEISSKLLVLGNPTNFRAIPSALDIKLVWDPVPDADYYKIKYYNYDSGNIFLVEDLIENTFTHTTPYYDRTNYYELFAYRKDGLVSDFSPSLSTQTTDLETVTNIIGDYVSQSSLRISWNNAPEVTNYKVYRSTSYWHFGYSHDLVEEITSGNSVTIDLTTLSRDEYGYWVVSCSGNAKKGVSQVFRHVYIPAPVITRIYTEVDLLCPVLEIDTSVLFGGDTINIYRSTAELGEYEKVQSNMRSYIFDDSLIEVGKYFYKVSIVQNDQVESPLSMPVEIRFNAPTTQPRIFYRSSNREASLFWTNNSFAKTYEVWRSSSENGAYENIASGLLAARYIDKGVGVGTYYYKVRGITETGLELDFSTKRELVVK